MHKLPITVIILSSGPSEKLVHAIQSVEWAEEVKVVELKEPMADFSAVRNEAAESAKQEIIFFLDSDEVVTHDFSQKLTTLIQRSDWNGIKISRRDIFLGKEMKWGEVRDVEIVRLFRKGKFHFERPVHEKAVVEGKVISSQLLIHHFAHDSISSFFGKILFYISLEVELRRRNKEKVSALALFLWPIGKFLNNYFFKLGILDGWQGLIYAMMMSVHSFGVRANLYESQSQK